MTSRVGRMGRWEESAQQRRLITQSQRGDWTRTGDSKLKRTSSKAVDKKGSRIHEKQVICCHQLAGHNLGSGTSRAVTPHREVTGLRRATEEPGQS